LDPLLAPVCGQSCKRQQFITPFSRMSEVDSPNHPSVVRRAANSKSAAHWLVFCTILGVGVVLRLIFFQGYSDSDPAAYALLAEQLARGEIHIGEWDADPIHFPVRVAIYVPTALAFRLFGVSELTIALVPLLVSAGGMVLAYLITRRLFNSFAGLLSIAILAMVPTDIAMATTLWPDPIAAFLANLGVACLILGFNSNGRNRSTLVPIVAGLCFGIAWLGKETVLYYGPFVAIFCFLRSQGRWSTATSCLLLVGLAALFVLVAEASIYRAYAGDWLFHFRSIEGNYKETSVWWFDQSSPYFGWAEGGYPRALLNRLAIEGPRALLSSFSKLPMLAIVALACAAFMKDRRFVVPAIWLLTLMGMFDFGSTSPLEYKPLPLLERYLYPILLPSAVLVSGALATLWRAEGVQEFVIKRRSWSSILLLAFSVSCMHDAVRLTSRPEQVVRDVLPKLRISDVVYTDHRSASTLVFLRTGKMLAADRTTIPYVGLSLESLNKGTYMFINRDKLEFLALSYGYKVPAFVIDPPKTWQNVWNEKGAVLFRVQ
jgi:4-amino-4-deoxy-L-arabinose transferase-like glycosyltransferase